MNAFLLAFLMAIPVNSTFDPETEYLPYGEEIIIRFVNVKIPLFEYELDCDDGCGYCTHLDQLEDLDTMENNEYICERHGDHEANT